MILDIAMNEGSTSQGGESESNNSLLIRPFHEIGQWDQFVESHRFGSIFHMSSMIRCQSETRAYEPYAMGALTENGDLCAVLAAVRVTTLGGLASRLASRSIFFAEPLYLDNPLGRLGAQRLLEAHDQAMRKRVLFAEVRPLEVFGSADHDPLVLSGYERMGYLNYVVDMNRPIDLLFQQLDAKRRNNIRSAERKGVTVDDDTTIHGTELLYDLLMISHRRSKIPLVDRSLFDSAIQKLPHPTYSILIAKYKGEPIAAGCFLAFKDRVICWYAGTKRLSGIAGTTLVFWEAMKRYSKLGYRIFDLAGAGWQGEDYGPGKFKAKFGGQLINIGRYRKVFAPNKLRIAEVVYGRIRYWLNPDRTKARKDQP